MTSDDAPRMSPATEPPQQVKAEFGGFESLVGGIIALALLFVLFAFFISQWQRSHREMLSRTQCRNNLKQLGLALHNYHDQYGSFPPAFVTDANGRPMHSWRILVLPFIEQQKLYEQYSFDEPWNGPNNIKLQDKMPAAFRCLSFTDGVAEGSLEHKQLSRLSNYAAITGSGCTFDGDSATQLDQFTDGANSTLAMVEVQQYAVHWMSPEDVTTAQWITDLRRSGTKSNANHHQCVNALLADGSVKLVPHDADEQTIYALATKAGGEDVPAEF